MDRRDFMESCGASLACASSPASLASLSMLAAAAPAFGADAKPRPYARVVLANEFGAPLKATMLKAQTNYVFHYPFEATPAFQIGRAHV